MSRVRETSQATRVTAPTPQAALVMATTPQATSQVALVTATTPQATRQVMLVMAAVPIHSLQSQAMSLDRTPTRPRVSRAARGAYRA